MKLCITMEKFILPNEKNKSASESKYCQGTVDRKGRKRVPRITCRYISVKISNSSLSSVFPPRRTAVAVGIILKWPQNPEFLPSVAAMAIAELASPMASITITTIPHVWVHGFIAHVSVDRRVFYDRISGRCRNAIPPASKIFQNFYKIRQI